MKELVDKVAVITGGASGIGLAIAERLARERVRLVLADVEPGALDRAVAGLKERGAEAIGVQTDVSDRAQIERLLAESVKAYGAVQLLFNNAGVTVSAPTWQITRGQWEWILGVNLWGVIHGVSVFVPHMLEQSTECHVVNTSSMAGLLSTPYMTPYQVTKHAVVTLTETLAQELAMFGPHVSASVLCPGFVQTNLHECERNRPAPHADGTLLSEDTETMMRDAVRQLVTTGKSPTEIADAVVDAIQNNRLYIFTHPELLDVFEARARRIMKARPV